MRWCLSWRADPRAAAIADRHYNRQKVGSPQFVPPGKPLVLLTPEARALWISHWPIAKYVKHAWAGAWMCSCFRNEARELYLSSELVREAMAATLAAWGTPPPLGMVTFVDATKTLRKRDPGRCFLRAGFRYAVCQTCTGSGWFNLKPCDGCDGDGRARTKDQRLFVLECPPESMPSPESALGVQQSLGVG